MSRIATITLWLMMGHALAGAAYIGLINTPESNVLMLVLSATLVLVGLTALVVTSTTAARGLHRGDAPWRGWAASVAMLPAVLVAIVVVGALCGLAGSVEAWWMARTGQVDAAAIAAGDVTRTDGLHATVHWLVVLFQWVLVPCWLASGLAWAAAYGTRYVATLKWIVAGLSVRLLVVALIAVIVLVWLPWRAVYWRPSGITTGSVEMAFTAIKLFGLFAAANLAWALVLDAAVRGGRP